MGLRFVNLAPEMRDRLKAWLESRAPEFEEDDPPAPCKLTDLSLGGCYLETGSPFPVRTRIILSMHVAGVQFRAEGVVLVMHPDLGMGVEFTQTTEPQREHLEKFIHALTNSNGVLPELMVEPEGLDNTESATEPETHKRRVGRKILCSNSSEEGPSLLTKPSSPNSANSEAPPPKPPPKRRPSSTAQDEPADLAHPSRPGSPQKISCHLTTSFSL